MTLPAEMTAWACRRYGGPERLEMVRLAVPRPKAGEVLVRVVATTVSSADARIRAMRMPPGFALPGRLAFGLRGPRRPVLGTEVAGVVAATGEGVTEFEAGDAVVAFLDTRMGGHAEYLVMPASGMIVPKPTGLSFETASAVAFGGLTARHYLRRAALAPGERLLVIGAAGCVGSAMVQLAVAAGAEVTAVVSAGNADLARRLGAGAVIDYTRQDLSAGGPDFDVVADTVAASSFARAMPRLREGGRYLAIAGGLADMLVRPKGTRRSISGPASGRPDDLGEIVRLAAAGTVVPPIDGVYPFADLPAAHARVDSGRKRGSVVVRVAQIGD